MKGVLTQKRWSFKINWLMQNLAAIKKKTRIKLIRCLTPIVDGQSKLHDAHIYPNPNPRQHTLLLEPDWTLKNGVTFMKPSHEQIIGN